MSEDDKKDEIIATIVDIRPYEEYIKRHLKGSVSFALDSLGVGGGINTRATELPSRSWPLSLIVMGSTNEETLFGLEWLESRGWKVNRQESLNEDQLDWIMYEEKELIEKGPSQSRFWKASPPLERRIHSIKSNFQNNEEIWALDLGCGSGRDAVYLALNGCHVFALDREESFLEKLQAFAVRQNVGSLVTTVLADLRPQYLTKTLDNVLESRKFDIIHLSRFMNRPLLGYLANKVHSNCLIVVHHFLVGAQSRHGKPFSKGIDQMLESFELPNKWFPSHSFKILMNEESTLSDGRPVVSFIAMKL